MEYKEIYKGEIKKIRGADLSGLEIGKRIKVFFEDGSIAITSPIVDYFKANSYLRIETQNSVYSTTGM